METKTLEEGMIKDFLSDWSYNKNKDFRQQQVDKYQQAKQKKIEALTELLSITQMIENIASGRFTLTCTSHLDTDLQALRPAIDVLESYERKQMKSIVAMLDKGVYEKFLQLCTGDIYDKYVSSPNQIKLSSFLKHYIDYENGKKPELPPEEPKKQLENVKALPEVTVYVKASSALVKGLLTLGHLADDIGTELVNYFAGSLSSDDEIMNTLSNVCQTLNWDTSDVYDIIANIVSEVIYDKDVLFSTDFLNYIVHTNGLNAKIFDLNYYICGFKLRVLLSSDFDSQDCADSFDRIRLITSNFNITGLLAKPSKDGIKDYINKELEALKNLNPSFTKNDKAKLRQAVVYLNRCGLID